MTIFSLQTAVVFVAFLLGVISSPAAPDTDPQFCFRPKIALVLSGGSARGAAHIGVLKVLEENRIPVDFIAATSMGAIIGGLYAAGMSPEEMDRTLTSTDWNDLFNDRPSRAHLSVRRKQEDMEALMRFEMGWSHGLTFPASFVAGDKLMFYLRKLTLQTQGISNFDQLPIPFRAVATDIENGDMVVLNQGSLAEALRASMAIPGAFAPQEIDGRLLVDGFLTANLPISVAREAKADLIIAVNVGTPLRSRSELKSILQFTRQTLGVMGMRNTREQLALLNSSDVLIEPALGNMGELDFERTGEAIARGETAARELLEALLPYAVSENEYESWRAAHRHQLTSTIKINSVRVASSGSVSHETIRKRARLKTGPAVKIDDLRRSLDRVYDLGAFELVDFKLENDDSELSIQPRERSTGQISVRAGLTLFSDLDGGSDFNFLTSVTATEMNARGAEWKNQVQFGRTTRVFTEWYQPIDAARSYFIAPYGEFVQDRIEATPADGLIFRANLRRLQTGLEAGTQLWNIAELRVGPVWGRTHAYDLRGITLPGGVTTITQSGMHAKLAFDQLDNVNFPREGYVGGLELFSSRKELGAGLNYNMLSATWNQAYSFGENTLFGGVHLGGKIGSDLPFYENFSLGGFLNLSGMPFESLSDQYSGLGRLIYYRRVAGSKGVRFGSIYVGGSIEAGGVWHDFNKINTKNLIVAGSAFVGVDTPVGPLYLAYGQSERGNHAFYFYLGKGF